MANTDDTRKLITDGPWHVWILGFGISHGRNMRIALHHGDYPSHTEVVCEGVQFFHGAMEGGPYHLRVLEERTSTGAVVVIADIDERFVLRCERVIERSTRP